MNKKEKRVFISHSHTDNVFVERLAIECEQAGIRSWLDLWEMRVGDSLRRRIESGISDSGWLVVVLSTASVDSTWVQHELDMAFVRELEDRQVFVLPALAEDCKMPLSLRTKFYADFRRDFQKGFDDLLATVLDISPRIMAKRRAIDAYWLQCDKKIPFMSALLTMRLEAGLDLRSALSGLIKDLPDPLRNEMQLCERDLDHGKSIIDTFDRLAHRIPTERMRFFVASVRNSANLGSPLSNTLRQMQNLTNIEEGKVER